MNQAAILYPVFALATLTFGVLMLVGGSRFRAGFRREVRTDDFKLGESANVPPHVSIPNRNYMNLLEVPVLFYVACLAIYVTATVSPLPVGLAWSYVALRFVHSAVHLTYNRVTHRLTVFALSNFVLGTLWIVLAVALAQ